MENEPVKITPANVLEFYPTAKNFHVRKGIFAASPYRIAFFVRTEKPFPGDTLDFIPDLIYYKPAEVAEAETICERLNLEANKTRR